MPEQDKPAPTLTPGAERLVDLAQQKQRQAKHAQLGVHHWLSALLERHGPMAEALAKGLEAASLGQYVQNQLSQGIVGVPLSLEALLGQSAERARARGLVQATERDVAATILLAAGYQLLTPEETVSMSLSKQAPTSEGETKPTYQPRTTRPTPTLEQFGRDLTREAAEGKLAPVIGREQEMQLLIETLCRRTKRNPALVGPAGVGKTAIVEGFAQRVVRGEVPASLQGVRIIAVQPSTLVAGAHMQGELEKRVKALLSEASQEGIILFLDEVHAIIGAGGMPGTSDIASLLKPVLARGELACIAAATDDEYRRFIEPDAALERRFQPIRVQEMTAEETLEVLKSLREEFVRLRGVDVPEGALRWLVDFSQRFLRNRFFPDKAVDLLEQCVAYSITRGKTSLDQADAQMVAQRMIGMPSTVTAGLAALKERLLECALLSEEDVQSLINRLEVSVRGLDLRPSHPNAVLLLLGEPAANREALASTIAEALFGAPERVVSIDFGRFVHPEDITMLVGAPPGYVGYSESLPLHRVAQMPWCVVLWENVHICHPQVRAVLTQALSAGFLTDARGRRIYLSDTIVLLTAEVTLRSQRPLGFLKAEEPSSEDAWPAIERVLGAELAAQVDLICASIPSSGTARRRWLEKHFLSDLTERYRKQGLSLSWDDSLITWLLSEESVCDNQRDWERLVDERLSPLLIRYLPTNTGKEVRSLLVRIEGGQIHVETY